MRSLACIAAVFVSVAVTAGCGSGKTAAVQIVGGTESTDGKAIVVAASTDQKLASQPGGVHALELRGIDTSSGGSFDHPGYVDPERCVVSPCEWTVVPDKAGDYEYKAFLIDLENNKAAGESDALKLHWASPPRPQSIKLLVNGKAPPHTPLTGESYSVFPAGPMQVEAKWTTDAVNTGYYVRISIDGEVYARCSSGTACPVPKKLPLGVKQEVSWTVELLTTIDNRVADGFKVCLEGQTKSKPT